MAKTTKLPKTFEEVCEIKGYELEKILPDVSILPEALQKTIIATTKMTLVVNCLNGDWIPNWDDYSEYKWYPWFYMDQSSGGFRFYFSVGCYTFSRTPARLCFRTKALCDHAAKYFIDVYKDMFVF